jgi:hypothetical protein
MNFEPLNELSLLVEVGEGERSDVYHPYIIRKCKVEE